MNMSRLPQQRKVTLGVLKKESEIDSAGCHSGTYSWHCKKTVTQASSRILYASMVVMNSRVLGVIVELELQIWRQVSSSKTKKTGWKNSVSRDATRSTCTIAHTVVQKIMHGYSGPRPKYMVWEGGRFHPETRQTCSTLRKGLASWK